LFLANEGRPYSFKELLSEEKIIAFFQKQFPDALKLIPNIAQEFANNPTGVLGTIKCTPWSYKNKTLILGDAAHAIVPFYGQGMNAAFEDVVVLDKILDQELGNWEAIFKAYEKARKEDTDAIADLAIDNYVEMRDHVAHPLFQQKRNIEMALEKSFPNAYFSKYSMVTFKENIGYNEAMKKGRAQDVSLLHMIKKKPLLTSETMTKEALGVVFKKLQKEIKKKASDKTDIQ
jgi:kynurenine 3-monooxygenase